MAQHDYVIDNNDGLSVRTDINNALAATVTNNSGATAPSTTYAYMWWVDTTTAELKQRNAADSAWVTLGEDGYLTVNLGGVAVDEEIILDGFIFDKAAAINKVDIYAREAPVGAALTIDFLKGAAEQTKIATLAAGVKKQSTTITGLSYTASDELGLKVKSVGSTTEGAEITIIIHYHISALA